MFAKKTDPSIERFLCQAINEPSIGLIELQKNVKQNVPLDTACQKKVKSSYEGLILAIPDIENSIMEVRNLQRLEMPALMMSSHIDEALKTLNQYQPT